VEVVATVFCSEARHNSRVFHVDCRPERMVTLHGTGGLRSAAAKKRGCRGPLRNEFPRRHGPRWPPPSKRTRADGVAVASTRMGAFYRRPLPLRPACSGRCIEQRREQMRHTARRRDHASQHAAAHRPGLRLHAASRSCASSCLCSCRPTLVSTSCPLAASWRQHRCQSSYTARRKTARQSRYVFGSSR
jgi:hypothetical protein